MYAACTHMGVGIHVYAYSQRPKGDPGCLLILIATLIPPKTGSVTGLELPVKLDVLTIDLRVPPSTPRTGLYVCHCT